MTTMRYISHIPANALDIFSALLRDVRIEFVSADPALRPHMPAVYVHEYDVDCDAGLCWSEEVFSELLP